MDETPLRSASDEALGLLSAYLRERVSPHPILGRFVSPAAACVIGSAAVGLWDEHSDLDLRLVLPDEEHSALGASLRNAHLWDPARDYRVRLEDREPFRRFPGVQLTALSAAQLVQELRFDLPVALWVYSHAAVLQDPVGLLRSRILGAGQRFESRLPDLRCEQYYVFRLARHDMSPRIMPRREATALAIQRGQAVRAALRLAFLADGKPYPYDKWLEPMAERETRCGESIVNAVRALVSARDAETIDHASKVLRDRVAFALQQGGVREQWLEQWWLWPSLAPAAPA